MKSRKGKIAILVAILAMLFIGALVLVACADDTTTATHNITWSLEGGAWVGEAPPATVVEGGSIARPTPDPTKDGYDFMGWFTAATGGTAITWPVTNVTANRAFYAQWEEELPDGYNRVTWNLAGGAWVGEPPASLVEEEGDIAEPTAPTRDGYSFDGWFTAATGGTAITWPVTGVTEAQVFYAQWTEVVARAISVVLNTGNPAWSPANIAVTFDSDGVPNEVTLPVPTEAQTPDGYSWDGWFLNEYFDGDVVTVLSPTLIDELVPNSGNLPVWGSWAEINEDRVVTISFVTNHDTWTAPTHTATNALGVTQTVPLTIAAGRSPAIDIWPDGYRFDGWFFDEARTERAGATTTAAGNGNLTAVIIDRRSEIDVTPGAGGQLTLYGRWEPVRVIDVVFTTNNPDWDVPTASVDVVRLTNQPTALPVNAATGRIPTEAQTPDGYRFGGWFFEPTFEDLAIAATGANLSLAVINTRTDNGSGTIRLYARWIEVRTVGGDLAGAGWTITAPATVDVGEDFTFTVNRLVDFDGVPTVTLNIAGTADPLVLAGEGGAGIPGSARAFEFTVPAASITGNITIVSVEGITGQSIPTTITGWTGVFSGLTIDLVGRTPHTQVSFSFTITLLSGFQLYGNLEALSLPFTMVGTTGTQTMQAERGTGDYTNVFTFTIPLVTGAIVLDTTGLQAQVVTEAGRTEVTGHRTTANYIVAGEASIADLTQPYTFTVTPRFSFAIAASGIQIAYTIGDGDPVTLTGTRAATGDWNFTIPASSLQAVQPGDTVNLLSVSGINVDQIAPNLNADFFNPANWVQSTSEMRGASATDRSPLATFPEAGPTGAVFNPQAPTMNDAGVLNFTGSNHGFRIGQEDVHLSFELLVPVGDASGSFIMSFFANPDSNLQWLGAGGETGRNRVTSTSGVLQMSRTAWAGGGGTTFMRSDNRDWISGGATGPVMSFGATAWQQIDIVIRNVGTRRYYTWYRNGERVDLFIDPGNPSTFAPINFDFIDGDMVEFRDPEEFVHEPATRTLPLVTTGNYFFITTPPHGTGSAYRSLSMRASVGVTVPTSDAFTVTTTPGNVFLGAAHDGFGVQLALNEGYFEVDAGAVVEYSNDGGITWNALTAIDHAAGNRVINYRIPAASVTGRQIEVRVSGIAQRLYDVTGLTAALRSADGSTQAGTVTGFSVVATVASNQIIPTVTYTSGGSTFTAAMTGVNAAGTEYTFDLAPRNIAGPVEVAVAEATPDTTGFSVIDPASLNLGTVSRADGLTVPIVAADHLTMPNDGAGVTFQSVIVSGPARVSNTAAGATVHLYADGEIGIRQFVILEGSVRLVVDYTLTVFSSQPDLPPGVTDLPDPVARVTLPYGAPLAAESIPIGTEAEFRAVYESFQIANAAALHWSGTAGTNPTVDAAQREIIAQAREILSRNYHLTANIDFGIYEADVLTGRGDVVPWGTQEKLDADFTGPGGSVPLGFRGIFDGRGFALMNFQTTSASGDFNGALFPGLAGGTIRNLNIVNARTHGAPSNRNAILVNSVFAGTIENVSIHGTIDAGISTASEDAWANGGAVFGGTGDTTQSVFDEFLAANPGAPLLTLSNIVSDVDVPVGTARRGRIYAVAARFGQGHTAGTVSASNIFVTNTGIAPSTLPGALNVYIREAAAAARTPIQNATTFGSRLAVAAGWAAAGNYPYTLVPMPDGTPAGQVSVTGNTMQGTGWQVAGPNSAVQGGRYVFTVTVANTALAPQHGGDVSLAVMVATGTAAATARTPVSTTVGATYTTFIYDIPATGNINIASVAIQETTTVSAPAVADLQNLNLPGVTAAIAYRVWNYPANTQAAGTAPTSVVLGGTLRFGVRVPAASGWAPTTGPGIRVEYTMDGTAGYVESTLLATGDGTGLAIRTVLVAIPNVTGPVVITGMSRLAPTVATVALPAVAGQPHVQRFLAWDGVAAAPATGTTNAITTLPNTPIGSPIHFGIRGAAALQFSAGAPTVHFTVGGVAHSVVAERFETDRSALVTIPGDLVTGPVVIMGVTAYDEVGFWGVAATVAANAAVQRFLAWDGVAAAPATGTAWTGPTVIDSDAPLHFAVRFETVSAPPANATVSVQFTAGGQPQSVNATLTAGDGGRRFTVTIPANMITGTIVITGVTVTPAP